MMSKVHWVTNVRDKDTVVKYRRTLYGMTFLPNLEDFVQPLPGRYLKVMQRYWDYHGNPVLVLQGFYIGDDVRGASYTPWDQKLNDIYAALKDAGWSQDA